MKPSVNDSEPFPANQQMIKTTAAMWKLWRSPETEESIGLLVKCALPVAEATELVRRAVESANLHDQDGVFLAEVWVQATAKGTSLWVTNCADLALALEVLSPSLLAVGLGEATITTLPVVRLSLWRADLCLAPSGRTVR